MPRNIRAIKLFLTIDPLKQCLGFYQKFLLTYIVLTLNPILVTWHTNW